MPSEWNLHYSRWVIQDGEPNREVEESFEWFAIECWSANELLVVKGASQRTATPVSDFQYSVTAEVVHVSEKACVIDFGLRAIGPRQLVPLQCAEGDYVAGDIGIGLPLCIEIVPEEILQTLEYSWHVNRISADMTPYISHPDDPTGRWRIRDISHVRYEQVSSTDSVKAHTYVLHCSQKLS